MSDQNDDPQGPDTENWVIPVPNSKSPAYAVIPWALFQRLRALAGGPVAALPRDAGTVEANGLGLAEPLPMDADLDRVVPLPMAVTDELWANSMDELPALEDQDEDSSLPLDVLERLLDGEHPLKVFRRHRALTQKQLAEMTGLNATYLSQTETRKRRGSTRVYRRLATALGVDIGDLIE